MNTSKESRRNIGLAALCGVLVTAVPLPARAAPATRPGGPVQQRLDALVRDDGMPGAIAQVRGRDGRERGYTAGVAQLGGAAEPPADGYVRIGSNTKMFTSVVVLQLVGEGRVGLDEPIETYLPGLVRGEGIDGRHITVRQLLQHTSGLPNYTAFTPPFSELQHRYLDPRQLLDIAFAHKASFAPGAGWEYSNTNYVLAGLLVERVTGRPIAEQVSTRIIEPLGLRHTYWPGVGDQSVRAPHPHGYEGPADVTVMDPAWGWAAGQMIATPSDLNRFMTALFGGRLLKPELLRQMQTAVTAPGFPAGWQYGLGLIRMELTCGAVAWGHGGDIEGYETRNAMTTDGRVATIAVTRLPSTEAGALRVIDALDTALCAS